MPQDLKQRTADPDNKDVAHGQASAANPPKAPGNSSHRKTHESPDQVQMKHGGVLAPFTSHLIAWVTSGCGDAEWRSLVARKRNQGAPPWLDGDTLGLDDLSHRVLLLALAHLIHTQGDLAASPFEPRQDLDGTCLVKHLPLPSPSGVFELAKRLAVDAPLRTRGYLEVENDWSNRKVKGRPVSISIAKFLRTDISMRISAHGNLLGLTTTEEESKDPRLDDLILPVQVRATLKRLLQQPPPLDKPFWIYLKGPIGSGRRSLAQAVAKHLGKALQPSRSSDVPDPGTFVLVFLSTGMNGMNGDEEDKDNEINTTPPLNGCVEAKAIEKFSDVNFAQLNSCLHFSSFEVGLLLNFHNWPLKDGGIKRLINTKA